MISMSSGTFEKNGELLHRRVTHLQPSSQHSEEEYRYLEERIATLQRELEQKDRELELRRVEAVRVRRLAALGERTAGITHEVRNPLGGIELYASLIAEQHEGEAKRLAGEILRAVNRLQTTISHLLSFTAELRVSADFVSVPVLFQEVTAAVVSFLHRETWSLKSSVEGALPLLYGDGPLLTRALANLVINAVEAMPQGGVIRLHAQRTDIATAAGHSRPYVLIRVEDEGVGIPPENREKIFDPFFTTKPTGTGLGLALTQEIIRAHNGLIEVSSAPVRGSCITVLLPAADRGDPVGLLAGDPVNSVFERTKGKGYEKTSCYS